MTTSPVAIDFAAGLFVLTGDAHSRLKSDSEHPAPMLVQGVIVFMGAYDGISAVETLIVETTIRRRDAGDIVPPPLDDEQHNVATVAAAATWPLPRAPASQLTVLPTLPVAVARGVAIVWLEEHSPHRIPRITECG